MKTNIMAILFVAALLISATDVCCQQVDTKPEPNTKQKTPVKIIEYIPGTWVIQSVYKGSEEVTTTDTLASMETIEFNREGRFMSYSGTQKLDSGAYRLNEQHAVLYLSSENNEEETEEWDVTFGQDGTMTVKKRNGEKQLESVKYVYKRSDNESSSNRKN